jgi:hypothetical protein
VLAEPEPPLSVATFHTISEPFMPAGKVNSLLEKASMLLTELVISLPFIVIVLK